jgi:hypothetical protein
MTGIADAIRGRCETALGETQPVWISQAVAAMAEISTSKPGKISGPT